MGGMVNNIFLGLGLSLIFPLIVFVIIRIFLNIIIQK